MFDPMFMHPDTALQLSRDRQQRLIDEAAVWRLGRPSRRARRRLFSSATRRRTEGRGVTAARNHQLTPLTTGDTR